MTLPAASLAPAPPILVTGVTARYRQNGRPALEDVTLKVKRGEVLGLVGPNGSGKTTLIRVATHGMVAEAGRVMLAGRDVASMRPAEIARLVAVVPQEPVLPAAFTAVDCVLMGRTPHLRLLQAEGPGDLEAARRAMVATGTWGFVGRRLGELSGGERQRVVVARALAQETPCLLLDEPTAHLDIGQQAAVLGMVREAAQTDGKAVLAVVHDLTLAAAFCDRLVLLSSGRVIAEGATEDVLREEVLRPVYGPAVSVFSHPATGRPVVTAVGPA